MKKILKTFSFLVALAAMYTLGLNTAQAQDAAKADSTSKKSKLMVGLRAGANVNYLRGSSAQSEFIRSLSSGAHVGLFVKYDFNNWVSTSLEAAWSQSGSRNMRVFRSSTGSYQSSGLLASLEINAIQLNPMIQFKLPVLSVYEPYAFIAPSFNINTISTAYVDGVLATSTAGYVVSEARNVDNSVTALDFGVLVGAGIDFNLRFATLTLDARYRHGLNDINNNGSFQSMLGGGQWKSSVASIQIGLGFPIGGK